MNFRPFKQVLCNISLIKEFRSHFGTGRGPRREHSHSYATDAERRTGAKGPGIVDRNLCYRALTYQKLLFFVVAAVLSLAADSPAEEVIAEKRIGVAMRRIGHEVLLCLGDGKSRVMPIEQVDEHYRIPFEFEFGFDPEDIISIIDLVMTETDLATACLVEVEQCSTKEIVHSFELRKGANPAVIACTGRILPEDCYSLLVTLLDKAGPAANLSVAKPGRSAINGRAPSGSTLAYVFKVAVFLVPLLLLIGVIVYLIRKKAPTAVNQDLVLIGASRFDKRNMKLAFENSSVELSNKEAELLSLLHTSANAPIEREVLLQRVWGDEGDYVGRTLDVFISKLRKKLEADTSVKIVNIRGIGYKLVIDTP